MNIDADTLTRVYALAHDSGKVDDGRLARALALVPKVQHTFDGTYTDGSHMDEYWIPGNDRQGYAITVRNHKVVSGCICKDHQNRKPELCKHMISVMLVVRAEALAPTSTPETVTVVAPLSDDYRRRMLAALWPQDSD